MYTLSGHLVVTLSGYLVVGEEEEGEKEGAEPPAEEEEPGEAKTSVHTFRLFGKLLVYVLCNQD